jgi:riboflavin kinase / FMN adenylyltransferase
MAAGEGFHIKHMQLIRLPEAAPPAQAPEVVATIGSFDGVHRGHRSLLEWVTQRADERGVGSAVVTFDPHPRLVLRPDSGLHLLSTVDEKAEIFRELGVDYLLVWRFDDTLRNTEAEQFFQQLNQYVRLRCLIHGPGFALGKGRRGTPEVIAAIGRQHDFEVLQVDPYQTNRLASKQDGELLTSTSIRALLHAGRVEDATWGLTRYPTVVGVVVEGERVGRTLGFPTANLEVNHHLAIPADGVYAAWAEVDPFTPESRRFPAAVSIGTRPTFDGGKRVVEAYLLDFSGDLYGRRTRLHFVSRLRGQERFETLDSLVAQMQRDVTKTRSLLLRQDVCVKTLAGVER